MRDARRSGPDREWPADDPEVIDDEEIITCWCGVRGTADELFADDPYLDTCGGTGRLYCHCGGDLCVCHHHGQEIECPGCGDCSTGDDDFEPDDYDRDDL